MPIILHFVDGLSERSAELYLAFKNRDWPQLRHLAHRMKSAGLFGYSQLTDAAAILERAAIDENVEVAETQCEAVAKLAKRIMDGSAEMRRANDERQTGAKVNG